MKFHGRIAPGRVTDLRQPVQVILHAPAKASGVTVKIWEMDTFDDGGRTKKEGTADDLLATFQGEISSAPPSGRSRPPDWRAFKVSDAKIESADDHVARVKLQFAGSDTTYSVPLLSENDEAEGDVFELGFSIEIGGSEKFRTRSPCLVAPPRRSIRVTEARFGDYGDDRKPAPDTVHERPMALRYAAIGVSQGDPEDAASKLKVLGNGYIDLHGMLVVHPDEADGADRDQALAKVARRDRDVFVYVHRDPAPLALGESKIPIAICDAVDDQGNVRFEVPDRRIAWGAQFVEAPRERVQRDGRSRFAPGEAVEVESPEHEADRADPHDVIARIVARFPGRQR
ncbi:MAG TPA: hypothetical protein VGD80_39975 [Kofleriaceae bacterium]